MGVWVEIARDGLWRKLPSMTDLKRRKEFPLVLLTKDERKTLEFWCPKTMALIDECNRLGVIALWNAKSGKPSMSRDEWSRALQRSSAKAA